MIAAAPASTPAAAPAAGGAGVAGFYVSVRTGGRSGRTALALGPFADRKTAEEQVEQVRRYVNARCRDAGWWWFGTARLSRAPGCPLPPGTLNAALGADHARTSG